MPVRNFALLYCCPYHEHRNQSQTKNNSLLFGLEGQHHHGRALDGDGVVLLQLELGGEGQLEVVGVQSVETAPGDAHLGGAIVYQGELFIERGCL